MVEHPCETCGGQGRTPSHEHVEVKVPSGVRNGAQIVIEGAGEAGVRGHKSGNLIVQILIEDDEKFIRRGEDLACQVTVDALDAILGTTLQIDGILKDEKIEVDIPAGTQNSDHIVVDGHGMPINGGASRGKLICVVQLVVGTDYSDDERETLKDIADAHRVSDETIVESDDEKSKPKKKRPHKKRK